MNITMTRRLMFSAAKADWLPDRSLTENRAIFGEKASPEPYGHNYALDVGVEGRIAPETGILVNIKEIDRIAKASVIHVFDRKYINRQVPAFCDRPVTAENIAAFIAETLGPQLPSEVTLARIRLEETPLHFVEWQAPTEKKERATMVVTQVYEFSASHRLHSPALSNEENQELFGKCNYPNGHGHNYVVEVAVAGPVEPRSGRVIDPALLDTIVNREVIERYDHRHLNHDIPEFEGTIPSAEVITATIWARLREHIPAPARLYRVLVKETARNLFETYGEDEEDR